MATQNTGQQGYFVLEQIFLDDASDAGLRKPNLAVNSPQATVPSTAAITYNYPTDVAPTGGANGDIWYNPGADQLFKKISGSWTLLTDRVSDADYIPPVTNLISCPLPTPAPQPNFMLWARYGMIIESLTNGNTTGIPPGFVGPTLGLTNDSLSETYSKITAGNAVLVLDGFPVILHHVRCFLQIDGAEISFFQVDGPGSYPITFPDDVVNPVTILIGFETF